MKKVTETWFYGLLFRNPKTDRQKELCGCFDTNAKLKKFSAITNFLSFVVKCSFITFLIRFARCKTSANTNPSNFNNI